jgi:hypothetical protein
MLCAGAARALVNIATKTRSAITPRTDTDHAFCTRDIVQLLFVRSSSQAPRARAGLENVAQNDEKFVTKKSHGSQMLPRASDGRELSRVTRL